MLIRRDVDISGCLRLQGRDDVNDDGDERKREPLHGVREMPLGPDAIGRSPGPFVAVRLRRIEQHDAAGEGPAAARAPVARVAENSARAASRRRDPRCPRQGACRVQAGDRDDRQCCATRRQLRSTAERRAWRPAQSIRDRQATIRLPRARAASALDNPPARIPRACCPAESDAADRSAREPAHADSAATNSRIQPSPRRSIADPLQIARAMRASPRRDRAATRRAAKTTRRRPLSADCRTSLGEKRRFAKRRLKIYCDEDREARSLSLMRGAMRRAPLTSHTHFSAMSLVKLLIVACLIAIVVSLGSGLFHLVNDKGESQEDGQGAHAAHRPVCRALHSAVHRLVAGDDRAAWARALARAQGIMIRGYGDSQQDAGTLAIPHPLVTIP